MTLSLSADLLERRIQVIGLEKWKQRYRDFYEIYSVLCLPQRRNLLTNSQKVRGEAIMVERTNSQGVDKVIHVYLLNLLNSVLTR